jgi:hypothetical protein
MARRSREVTAAVEDGPGRGVAQGMRFLLTVEGDLDPPLEFTADITLGRHLENDLVLPGEDVADYHARVEVGARAVHLVPLSGCVVEAGGGMRRERLGLMPGTTFGIGMHRLHVDVVAAAPQGGWSLVPGDGRHTRLEAADTVVGRGAECRLRLTDGHVSRRHALVALRGGAVWVQDLQSSNGTFVNGERVIGACRLFHGDVVAFDDTAFQLIGSDPDLTPVIARV